MKDPVIGTRSWSLGVTALSLQPRETPEQVSGTPTTCPWSGANRDPFYPPFLPAGGRGDAGEAAERSGWALGECCSAEGAEPDSFPTV